MIFWNNFVIAQYEFLQELPSIMNRKTNQVVICNLNGNDAILEEVVQLNNHHGIWTTNWDCLGSSIPQVQDSFIILNEIEPFQWHAILQKQDIQLSLSSNHWIIYTLDFETIIDSYFNQEYLRIGIDAKITFVKHSYLGLESITQITGKGTFNTELKVFKNCWKIQSYRKQSDLKFQEIDTLSSLRDEFDTKTNVDFKGIPFRVNYIEDFSPYCFLDENGLLIGIVPDIIREVALMVNLTLIFQKPNEKNKNIWLKRYYVLYFDG